MMTYQEMFAQAKINQLNKELGISDTDFEESYTFYTRDPPKFEELMLVKQSALGNWESFPELSKEKTIEAFKCLWDINKSSVDEMAKDQF